MANEGFIKPIKDRFFYIYINIPMLKNALIILSLGCSTSLFAQEESFARYFKASAADTLLPIATSVKLHLLKEMQPFKKGSPNYRFRLALRGSNKESGIITTRWLAAKQERDIYYVNWVAVQSKYFGETEKNLAQLFSKADLTQSVLFFDEADALFGLRTDSAGRTANPFLTYWLKQIDEYKGSVIIACSGKDCLAILGKKKFTAIQVGAPMETQ